MLNRPSGWDYLIKRSLYFVTDNEYTFLGSNASSDEIRKQFNRLVDQKRRGRQNVLASSSTQGKEPAVRLVERVDCEIKRHERIVSPVQHSGRQAMMFRKR